MFEIIESLNGYFINYYKKKDKCISNFNCWDVPDLLNIDRELFYKKGKEFNGYIDNFLEEEIINNRIVEYIFFKEKTDAEEFFNWLSPYIIMAKLKEE
ncbi:MAG: hypothetical protein ACOCP8_01850 [archaeon]